MHTLHLTDAEAKVYAGLPADLTEGRVVEKETLTYEDTDQRRAIRMKQLTVTDAALKKFFSDARGAKTQKEFLELVRTIGASAVSGDDAAELLFAIGPDGTGALILQALEHAKTAEDLDLATALSLLRHEMLESLSAPTI